MIWPRKEGSKDRWEGEEGIEKCRGLIASWLTAITAKYHLFSSSLPETTCTAACKYRDQGGTCLPVN